MTVRCTVIDSFFDMMARRVRQDVSRLTWKQWQG